jgi:hypothetical protein
VVVLAESVVVVAAQAEGVDEHLVGLAFVIGAEEVEHVRVWSGERPARSWTCGFVLRPVGGLTFCRWDVVGKIHGGKDMLN